ncbi:MAG TPA: hypothetical protein VGW76_05515 [Pyrinomonadaceae bacterium]|nr:hypothetical protein [Pyrinomonadaceae bacterium]
MKKILRKTSMLLFSLNAIMLFASITLAQDSSCNAPYTGVGNAISGEWDQIFDSYCQATKTQYEFQGTIPQSIHVIATNAAGTLAEIRRLLQ